MKITSCINSDDPNKTASDSEITVNSIEHHLSDSITSVENLNINDENWDNYKKQRNFCVKLLHQTKEKYFSDINVKSISDNKRFWKTIKPFFSNKGLNTNNMMLVEDNEIVREEEIIANIMNNYFINITQDTKILKKQH